MNARTTDFTYNGVLKALIKRNLNELDSSMNNRQPTTQGKTSIVINHNQRFPAMTGN